MKTKSIYRKLIRWTILSLLPFALVLTCATASSVNFGGLGKANDLVPLTRYAITGTLPNGLKYYILENSYPENRAHLALAVNAGSVLERDDERGFAHFTEHLAFNDTARFPKLELIEYLRSLGMRFGADANAYTSYDETVYHFDVPVEVQNGVKRIPEKALAIIDDWTHAVSFNPEDVANESRVVLEELRGRLGAMDRVRKITLPILFSGSPYAQREPIGLAEVIENATSQKVKGFYDRWYTGDNMALIFVGDFDGKALEAELVRHFNMPAPAKPVNRPRHELPPPQKGQFRVEIITDPELTSASYSIYYKQNPGAARGTLSSYRESVIDYLIDTMLSLRFEETSSKPESAASRSSGGMWHWSVNSRFYTMGTRPKTGKIEDALHELLMEKESVRRFGFTGAELERAKLSLVSTMEKMASEKDRQNSRTYIRGFTSHFLTGEDMADIEWELEAVNALLPGIGVKEIAQAVSNYFKADDCTVFLMAPEAEAANIPSKERIKAIFNETAKAKIAAKVSDSLSDELLERQPQPGKITEETTDQTGAVIFSLSNGAKVILKETSNKNNEVVFYAAAKGGTVNSEEAEAVSVGMLSEMVNVSGLGPYTRTELVNKLAGKQVSFSFWTGDYYRGFQGSSVTKDIKTLFEMICLFFTDPQFDDSAIAAMLDQYRTSLAHLEDDPQRVFSREITKLINGSHPRFKPLELADIDNVSLEKAFAFLEKCLNPQDYTFVFTGNFDIKEMRGLCEKYIASIPASQPMNQWTDPGIKRPGKIERAIYKGKEEKCTVYLVWFARGSAAFSEERNQTAAVLSEYLDILLTDEIREKMGGVYSISAGASVSVIPNGEYRLSANFNCDPARANELAAAVKELITAVGAKPLNQETFNQSKEALLKEHENSLQRNLHIAQSYANSSALYNTPLSRLNARPDVIKAVRPENVQELCRDMIVSGPVQAVLYPESAGRE
ncbi:MAG: insulinase family protein [Treponema sp.]|jgi:zinc protease|nr:insulinase family protein [Treponema sp.]